MNAVAAGQGAGVLPRLNLDGWLLVWVMLLISGGLAILFSASGGSGDIMLFQVSRLLIGIGLMLVLAQISPRFMIRATPWAYGAVMVLLVLVLLVGEEGGGARRWLTLGVRFQPSEFAKLAAPLMLACFFHGSRERPGFLKTLAALLLIAAPAGLVISQPDLGTAVVIVCFGFIALLLAGLNRKYIYGSAALGMLAIPALWVSLRDYQRERILSMLNPESDPLGVGYHVIQSKITIGSGGAFGKGFMDSSQAQFGFLPEPTTDFIFAVIGEEFGFVGVVVAMLLFIAITVRMLQIAFAAQWRYSRIVAASLALGFFVSFALNAAMTTGLLPVVGLPLPLVSVAGSANVTFLAGFGILMAIRSDRRYLAR
ncbi:MAG: rod shape-determining protein RodA [Gammaproteobacteria bacterium]|nr:rod shape-determining protein RodA [Gammaproteobacteria bacterium]